MHSHSRLHLPTWLLPVCSPRPYTRQFLHKPTFTASFYTNTLLHQALFAETSFHTNPLLHKPPFTPTSFTQTSFYTHQLLRKPTFRPTSFYTNNVLCQPTFTNQLLHQPAFTQTNFSTNSILRKPPFTPSSFRQPLLWACRPKARGPAECRRRLILDDTGPSLLWLPSKFLKNAKKRDSSAYSL